MPIRAFAIVFDLCVLIAAHVLKLSLATEMTRKEGGLPVYQLNAFALPLPYSMG
jgi:hypothetical protein